VPLLVDTASAARRLGPDEFARWAATRPVFLSSEMRELGELRRVLATMGLQAARIGRYRLRMTDGGAAEMAVPHRVGCADTVNARRPPWAMAARVSQVRRMGRPSMRAEAT
jgi:hypothetical protein